MPSTLRRTARITVRTPVGPVDLTVTDDAPAADVLRVLGPSLRSVPAGEGGWELVDARGGALPPAALMRSCGLRDGDVLLLRPREHPVVEAPVDDLAATVRDQVGMPPETGVATGFLIAGLLLPAVAALMLLLCDVSTTAVAIGALVTGALVPSALGGRTPVTGPVGSVSAAVGATLLALPSVASPAPAMWLGSVAALLAGGVSSRRAAGWVASTPIAWATAAVVLAPACVAGVLGAEITDPRALAPTMVAVLIVLDRAGAVASRTSGLGRLDDLVVAGRAVSEGEVAAAVRRATHDLGAVVGVCAVAGVVVPCVLAFGGTAACLFAVGSAAMLALQSRHLVRPWHVAPVLAAGVTGAVGALVAATLAVKEVGAPALVAAGVVLLTAAAGTLHAGIPEVTASRLRRSADLAHRIGVVVLPLMLAGVFDLYRVLWGMFASTP